MGINKAPHSHPLVYSRFARTYRWTLSSQVMIANTSPAGSHLNDTLSTLRFAERAKQIVNCARINLDPAHEKLLEVMASNAKLTARVAELENELNRVKQLVKIKSSKSFAVGPDETPENSKCCTIC